MMFHLITHGSLLPLTQTQVRGITRPSSVYEMTVVLQRWFQSTQISWFFLFAVSHLSCFLLGWVMAKRNPPPGPSLTGETSSEKRGIIVMEDHEELLRGSLTGMEQRINNHHRAAFQSHPCHQTKESQANLKFGPCPNTNDGQEGEISADDSIEEAQAIVLPKEGMTGFPLTSSPQVTASLSLPDLGAGMEGRDQALVDKTQTSPPFPDITSLEHQDCMSSRCLPLGENNALRCVTPLESSSTAESLSQPCSSTSLLKSPSPSSPLRLSVGPRKPRRTSADCIVRPKAADSRDIGRPLFTADNQHRLRLPKSSAINISMHVQVMGSQLSPFSYCLRQ